MAILNIRPSMEGVSSVAINTFSVVTNMKIIFVKFKYVNYKMNDFNIL